MDNSNALFVFECLLRDDIFMTTIDDYIINTLFITKTFDAKNVPQMVLILMTLLTKQNKTDIDVEKHIKNEGELQQLLEIFYTYITDRIKENPYLNEFNTDEFKKSYDICTRLAVMKLKFSNKYGMCCIRGQAP